MAIASNGTGEGGAVTIYPVLENGMPDWTKGQEIDTRDVTYTSIKDMAWDYAGNLYLAADSIHKTVGQCIAVYALPQEAGKVVSTPVAKQYAFRLAPKATPEPVQYEVVVVLNDSTMGRAEGAGFYNEGQEVTLTALPNAGYEFVSWTLDEELLTSNPLILTVEGNITLLATFKSTVTTGADKLENDTPVVRKLIRDGVVYIIRNGQVYTVVGN